LESSSHCGECNVGRISLVEGAGASFWIGLPFAADASPGGKAELAMRAVEHAGKKAVLFQRSTSHPA